MKKNKLVKWETKSTVTMNNKSTFIVLSEYEADPETSETTMNNKIGNQILKDIQTKKWVCLGGNFFRSKEVIAIMSKSEKVQPPKPDVKFTKIEPIEKKWWQIW